MKFFKIATILACHILAVGFISSGVIASELFNKGFNGEQILTPASNIVEIAVKLVVAVYLVFIVLGNMIFIAHHLTPRRRRSISYRKLALRSQKPTKNPESPSGYIDVSSGYKIVTT